MRYSRWGLTMRRGVRWPCPGLEGWGLGTGRRVSLVTCVLQSRFRLASALAFGICCHWSSLAVAALQLLPAPLLVVAVTILN